MLDFFCLPKDGPHYQRLVSGFQRIFTATILFGTEETPSGARLIDFSRFHFFDRMRLWFNSDPARQTPHSVSHDNVVTLSDAFHQEIDQHPIPVEREAIVCLAHAPGTLDFLHLARLEDLDGKKSFSQNPALRASRPQPPVGYGRVFKRPILPA